MAQAQAQQSAPNFGSILDKQSSEIERPKPLPVGTYIAAVQGLPRIDKSSKKQTEFSEYTLKLLAAQDDVDADALTEMGGIANKTIKATYYHTDDAAWRLKKFLDDLGIEEEDEDGEGLSLRQRMQMVAGRQVLVTIKHTASDDGTTVYANVNGTAAVE